MTIVIITFISIVIEKKLVVAHQVSIVHDQYLPFDIVPYAGIIDTREIGC